MEPSTIRQSAVTDEFRSSASNMIVVSRMLILRSKLLMLGCAQRLFERTRDQDDLKRIEKLRADLHGAETSFAAIETHGKSAGPSNRAWIYHHLIDVARTSMAKLKHKRTETPTEKFEVATDLQMLEELVERWSKAIEEESRSA
jgi:hypothetical protein